MKFSDIEVDIFENRHLVKTGETFEDSVMYLKVDGVVVDQVTIIKLIKTDASQASFLEVNEANSTS